jgi:hypothetical protein
MLPRMFFTPPQGFSVIPKCFDFEVIALRTRNRDRILARVSSHGDFKTYRSVGSTIRDRIGLNEVPTQHIILPLASSRLFPLPV